MDPAIQYALDHDLTVDITTTGRRSGQPRRLEIWMLQVEGRWFITGTPGPRDWLANLRADPRLTLHLKESATADLPARAVEVTDGSTRRLVLTHAVARWYRSQHDVEGLVADAPMVELFFEQSAGAE